MNRFASGDDEMVTPLLAYTFKPRMRLCEFWLKKIILLLLMFAKNNKYPISNILFTDEKHHRDTDEAFRKVSERASWGSKGKSIALPVISHI